jgi:hypothetical protein
MAKFHHLYHGGLGCFIRNMYQSFLTGGCCSCPAEINPSQTVDAAFLDKAAQLGTAGHKGYTDAALSRTLDWFPRLVDTSFGFDANNCLVASEDNGRMQVGFAQYIKCVPIAQDDTIGLVVIPPHSLLQGVAIMVEVPEAGVVFDVVEVRSGKKLGSIDCATIDSKWFALPAGDQWLNKQRMVALVAKSYPAAGPKSLRITTSPVITDPWNGN